MVRRILGLLLPVAGAALAVWLSTLIIPGISVTATTTWNKIGTVVLVALLIGAVNLVVKPLAKMILFAPYLVTLGLIALVVNGLLLLLTSWLASWLGIPFHVDSFFPAGVLGALFIAVVSWVLHKASDKITG